MGPRTRRDALLQDSELLIHSQRASALDAEASLSYCPALLTPSPSPSPGNWHPTIASAPESTADYTYPFTPPSQTLATPRLSRKSTWHGQSPTGDNDITLNHASLSTLLSRNLLITNTSTRPSGRDSLRTGLAQQNQTITEDVKIASEALWALQREAHAVNFREGLRTLKSLDDSTDDEEGATITRRDIACHGNTYLNFVAHAGCALWDLIGQVDPASIDSQQYNRVSTPTLEDRNGELDCPRCSPFEKSRAKQFANLRNKREHTVPLTEDAQDCIKDRRTGAAEYDDAYHDCYRFKLQKDQLKRQERYIANHNIIAYRNTIALQKMKPETRARREAEKAARLELQRTAPYERAYEQVVRNRNAETARIRAENKAEYERVKETIANPKPQLSWEEYVDSLPTPDPKALEIYTKEFVPTPDWIIPPNPANSIGGTSPSKGSSSKPRWKRTLKVSPSTETTTSPPTESTPSPASKKRKAAAVVRTMTPVSANKRADTSSASPPTTTTGSVSNKKRKASASSAPVSANKRTKRPRKAKA